MDNITITESKKLHNVTLVTAYYNLSSISRVDYLLSGVRTLNIRQPMVVFTGDEESKDFVTNCRNSIGLAEITKVILIPLEDLYFYKHRDLINENRENYWPTNDFRGKTDIYIVHLSKIMFVEQVSSINYFDTTHIGWIDFNLLSKSPHGSINYTSDEVYPKIDEICNNPKDRFSIAILNFWESSQYNDLRSFYSTYKFVCVGGFYTVDIKTCKKIAPKLINYGEYTILRGYGNGEESIIGHIIDQNPDDFNLHIGDYQDAIHNYYKINTNHWYCQMVINKYKQANHIRYTNLLPYINGEIFEIYNTNLGITYINGDTKLFGINTFRYLSSVEISEIKIIDIQGVLKLNNPKGLFENSNIESIKGNVILTGDCSRMFYNATNFNCDLSNWDVTNVTYMNNMFYNVPNLDCDFTNWNISNVADLGEMFQNETNSNEDKNNCNTLKILGKINNVFYDYIEIGTSDFDTEIEKKNNKIGISVEPIKYYLDRLPNKKNCLKLNLGISNYNGLCNVNYLPEKIISEYRFPDWVRGCNSVNSYHKTVTNLCIEKGIDIKDVSASDSVKVLTLHSLMDKLSLSGVYFLKIDTEGHDTVILKHFYEENKDTTLLPHFIQFESNVLSTNESVDEIISLFSAIGYDLIAKNSDTFLRLNLKRLSNKNKYTQAIKNYYIMEYPANYSITNLPHANTLESAKEYCSTNNCSGVTLQNGIYEVRNGKYIDYHEGNVQSWIYM